MNPFIAGEKNQKISFEKAKLVHKDKIFSWLDEPHVKAFWDNCQAHRDDILIFMKGRKESSPYFNGSITYWVGSVNNDLYCFLLTSEFKTEENTPPLWRDNAAKSGHTYTIDFCIGNKNYLGKGMAAPTLIAFTEFFKEQVDQHANRFFIDPDVNNTRAQHVYAQAGFKLVGEFLMENGFFAGQKTWLMVKDMS